MGREDRQDINKRRVAGSDVPPRGKGVRADNAKGERKDVSNTAELPKPKPAGYKGEHRRKD